MSSNCNSRSLAQSRSFKTSLIRYVSTSKHRSGSVESNWDLRVLYASETHELLRGRIVLLGQLYLQNPKERIQIQVGAIILIQTYSLTAVLISRVEGKKNSLFPFP